MCCWFSSCSAHPNTLDAGKPTTRQCFFSRLARFRKHSPPTESFLGWQSAISCYIFQFHFFPAWNRLDSHAVLETPAWVGLLLRLRKTTKTLSPNTATCPMTTYFEVLTTSLATSIIIPYSNLAPKDLQSCFPRLSWYSLRRSSISELASDSCQSNSNTTCTYVSTNLASCTLTILSTKALRDCV